MEKQYPSRRRRASLLRLSLCAAGLVVLFGLVLQQVVTSGPLVTLDYVLDHALGAIRAPGFIPVFDWISALGGTAAATALIIVVTALLWAYGRRPELLSLWIVFLGTFLSIEVIKRLVGRVRPEPLAGPVIDSYGFPSGNTTIPAAIYGFLAVLLARELTNRYGQAGLALGALVVTALCGFSRLYLHVHYLSDVMAGALLGALWVLIGVALLHRLGRGSHPSA
jgi:undecaprenyl-diphosphatase